MSGLISQLIQTTAQLDTSWFNSAMLVFIIGNLIWLSRKFGDLYRRMASTEKWQNEVHICPNTTKRKRRSKT